MKTPTRAGRRFSFPVLEILVPGQFPVLICRAASTPFPGTLNRSFKKDAHEAFASCTIRFMSRKNELRDKALDYFLEHGLAELSLRPLADEIGTSSRLLIYHFESKEKLIAAVMEEARSRTQRSFAELLEQADQDAGLRVFWGWVTDPKNVGCARLLHEVQVLALRKPEIYSQYLDNASVSWLNVIESRIPRSPNSRAIATLCGAVIDGLLLDYMSTGDLGRTTDALNIFDSLLQGNASE
ncbi:TetR/AcrR family transcriptional regulator [Rugamonas rivuli]|uniref:TetR family transcriptional regulator n=1 Tax=Rugamonas rivuli TaxID=2743358 RepID=A0A843SNC6_9BURK|nr:TetR/AcrR family transcriptional regulator [Rugamonas rivuli]MQA23374.1 TetR family transcriptional regulator [Rugamonas rivuli]